MVKSGQFTAQESKLVFDLADSDGDGSIDIGEFVQLMFPSAGRLEVYTPWGIDPRISFGDCCLLRVWVPLGPSGWRE